MNSPSYRVERLERRHVDTMVEWMRQEGWNPGLTDADSFWAADPRGFFGGFLDDRLVAAASAVVYDERIAFCGCYIVAPDMRGRGFGLELTKARLAYVGDRITGLDGVLNMTNRYERLGYVPVHANIRYVAAGPVARTDAPLERATFELVRDYDRRFFPAARPGFLREWLEHTALAWVEDGQVRGYGVSRPCFKGRKVGPLFADTPEIAEALFCNLAGEGPAFLDIPGPNEEARKLVERHGMTKVFETVRMYRNGDPELDLNGIYGITTFELG